MVLNEMSSRERMGAKLSGQEVDHIPFWSKLTGTYVKFQDPKWRNCSLKELHNYIGFDFLSYSNVEVQRSLPDNMAYVLMAFIVIESLDLMW